MTRRPQDHFGRRAKREGFPARSVYKLEEIDKRVRLFRAGQKVLDLGAFPGSWTLYAAERVGPKGRVTGLDIQAFNGGLPPHAEIRHADIYAQEPSGLGEVSSLDVVMSDMAPSTSGQRFADQYHSYELFMRALEFARVLLKPGGMFVGKIFQGPDFDAAKKSVHALFEQTRIIKPEASRKESYEVFLVGLRKKE